MDDTTNGHYFKIEEEPGIIWDIWKKADVTKKFTEEFCKKFGFILSPASKEEYQKWQRILVHYRKGAKNERVDKSYLGETYHIRLIKD